MSSDATTLTQAWSCIIILLVFSLVHLLCIVPSFGVIVHTCLDTFLQGSAVLPNWLCRKQTKQNKVLSYRVCPFSGYKYYHHGSFHSTNGMSLGADFGERRVSWTGLAATAQQCLEHSLSSAIVKPH